MLGGSSEGGVDEVRPMRRLIARVGFKYQVSRLLRHEKGVGIKTLQIAWQIPLGILLYCQFEGIAFQRIVTLEMPSLVTLRLVTLAYFINGRRVYPNAREQIFPISKSGRVG